MYAKQSAHFDRLLEAGFSEYAVQIFRDIFANPQVELHHEGIVNITGDVVGPKIQSGRWGVAQHNWDYNPDSSTYPSAGGKMGYVVCKQADDMNGTGTTGRSDISVYLPTAPGQDPNIIAGDVILFFETPGGTLIAPGYGDLRIGTVRADITGESESKGWKAMNSTENGKANGGSGIDLRDKFLRQWSSSSDSGTSCGSSSASLTIEGTITANGIGNHSHELSESSIATGDGSSGTVSVVTGSNTADEGVDLGTISVSFTGSGGSGSPSVSGVTPPFVYAAFFERVNNSRTGLGQ